MNLFEIETKIAALPQWRWMPGMLVVGNFPGPYRIAEDRFGCYLDGEEFASRNCFPCIEDHATKGCILALIRDAMQTKTGISVCYSSDFEEWRVHWSGSTHGGLLGKGKTEGEALADAFLNACSNTQGV